jgi:AcrR family transcriptional regulator
MVSTTLTVGAGRPRDPRIDEAVVAAVVELLCEVGYQRLSIAAVAARAGTTKPAVYRRWPTKAQLVHEAVFPAEGRPLVPETDDLAADLRSMLTDGIALFSRPEVRAAAPGLLADLAQDPGAHPRLLARFTSPMFDQLQGRLERAAAAHQVRPDVDARLLVDVIGGSTFMAVLTRDRAELEGPWVDQTLALLLAGVQA